MTKRNPYVTTAEDYEREEIIYPGRMSDYLKFLNDEEKAFFKDVITMYDNPSKQQAAGEVALGIIEARRVDERRSPKQEVDKTRRMIESGRFGLREGFGTVGNIAADSIYGKKTPGDRMPQNMLEGQRLAEVFPDVLSDDDFMRVSIAQIVEKNARPKQGIVGDIVDYGYKFIRDNDPGGFDKARSPTGIRFPPTPPPGFNTYSYGELTGAEEYQDGSRPISENKEVPDAALRPEDVRKRREKKKKR